MTARPTYPNEILLRCLSVPVKATVTLPGSKSITNRALIIAALATGTTHLSGVLQSDDTEVMQAALAEVGVDITTVSDTELTVHGVAGRFAAPKTKTIQIGNSGTSVRFLTAALTQMPKTASVTLDGVPRMRHRPIAPLMQTLRQLGASIRDEYNTGCPPVTVTGGTLLGGAAEIDGTVSSQFLSAVMMVGPYADENVTLSITGDLISKPYVDLTAGMMREFGAHVEVSGYKSVQVRNDSRYIGREYAVEADASNATYFMAAAAITGGTVTFANLSHRVAQGDIRFIEVLESMGCTVCKEDTLSVTGPAKLRGINWNMEAIPDTAQTLAVLACYASGPSHVTGLLSLRVKETDRVSAVASELRKLGAVVEEGADYWKITPAADTTKPAAIDTYDDHRMAMSFAVAGLVRSGVTINDPGCVAKTFPTFWDQWGALNRS